MPFGLCNAPATFQRLMNLILGGLQLSSCLVYLDDIIVMGRSFDEHLRNLATVFDRIREAGLKLKPAKCQFLQDQVQYLGHIVTREGIAADPSILLPSLLLNSSSKTLLSIKQYSVMGVDATFNLGDFHVTIITYQNFLLRNPHTSQPPVFIGPAFIHMEWREQDYHTFFLVC